MFYKMIENKCKEWYSTEDCTIRYVIEYIEKTGQMRDAQIEAIKVYLFLKIGCGCKPLDVLFKTGVFNTIDLNEVELSTSAREYLENSPAATALLEYSRLRNDKGEQLSETLEKQIKKDPSSIDYDGFFSDAFYKVSYTDYLFSLPMGAGKTYLMAAFIYLDLYFAVNEPANPIFAHNFIILAPSGLKSSVVPSLKTIQKFEPSWIIPEPAATNIKRMISFEVLDQPKTSKKSNKIKNPNVQKIANHQPFHDLFGLIAVTNAEKVILDRIEEKNGQISLFEESDDEKDKQANELRNLIGKLPFLSVFIDEVHHAVSDEIKLRVVVTNWAQNNSVNSVVGFSGTPYLEKSEKLKITDSLSVGTSEIANIVYYYPLIDGVGNFLKRPVVKIETTPSSSIIIKHGVREFLDLYKDTVYDGGLTAKLGIYCNSIEKLEETVYPLVSRILAEYGMGSDCILKFHRGNSSYPQPVDSQMQYDLLDDPTSKIRIVLLVQIGKEGWDCRSLTGIILSQEGDCRKNMVLQTSCRCLRQVVKGSPETALIYLNESNAEKLKIQLEQQQHITIDEFSSANNAKNSLKRYDRTSYLKLPQLDFYQLKINYETLTVECAAPTDDIVSATDFAYVDGGIIKTTDLTMAESKTSVQINDQERGDELITFNAWVYRIMKGGFGSPTIKELMSYEALLKGVFEKITYDNGETRCFSSKYDHKLVESNIRKAFCDKRDFNTTEELIPEKANLLNIANFTSDITTDKPQDYYPDSRVVENIILDDNGKLKIDPEMENTIHFLEKHGNKEMAASLRIQNSSHINKNRSFHYLPYHTDGSFEQTFLKDVLSLDEIERLGLEVYYNGDRAMTEFKIKCYKRSSNKWIYIGLYTPDFLIIRRKDGNIHKIVIVETKGGVYANDPIFKDKRSFMETEFAKQNNAAYGYDRFDYLYLEDTMSDSSRIQMTRDKICDFFKEV